MPEKIKYAEHVAMSQAAYTQLTADFGQHCVDWCVEKLNNYKASTGKKYKSDSHAIRNWVVDLYKQKHPQSDNPPSYDIDKILEHSMNNIPKYKSRRKGV